MRNWKPFKTVKLPENDTVSFNEELKVSISFHCCGSLREVSFNEELKDSCKTEKTRLVWKQYPLMRNWKENYVSNFFKTNTWYPLMRNWKSSSTQPLTWVAPVSFNEELKDPYTQCYTCGQWVSFNEELKVLRFSSRSSTDFTYPLMRNWKRFSLIVKPKHNVVSFNEELKERSKLQTPLSNTRYPLMRNWKSSSS